MVWGMSLVFIPTPVSATEWSGTSPSFSTDTTWSLDVGWVSAGQIIAWYWATYDSLIFSVDNIYGSHYSGLTYDDGLVVDEAGEYVLRWFNDNLIFSATVDYWVVVFTPSTTISTPIDGAYVNSTTIAVQGSTDSYSTGVLVGPDAWHLSEASWSGDDWAFDQFLPNEGYNSILVRTYYWLDLYGYKNVTYDRMIHVHRDTILPDLAIFSPLSDINYPNHYLKDVVNISWQCSDESGILKREVKVDALGWQEVQTDSYSAQLADGNHVVNVRVTDSAGNVAEGVVVFICDTVAPDVDIGGPGMNTKISKDSVSVWWYGGDALTGIDHYEVRIAGGDWIDAGDATDYSFTGLGDGWYLVDVKAVDRSGNEAISSVSFGIYTSIWSQNGPYHGIPMYAVIAAIMVGAIVAVLLLRKRGGSPTVANVPKEEPAP